MIFYAIVNQLVRAEFYLDNDILMLANVLLNEMLSLLVLRKLYEEQL